MCGNMFLNALTFIQLFIRLPVIRVGIKIRGKIRHFSAKSPNYFVPHLLYYFAIVSHVISKTRLKLIFGIILHLVIVRDIQES